MNQLPTWAQELKDRHPDGAMPTREEPIPDWLAEETRRMPLWYIIRGADAPRHEHPFRLHDEVLRQPDQWQEILDNYWPTVERLADEIVKRGIEGIITTGCGSAFFTAIHGEAVLPTLSGIDTRAIESYELTHYFPNVDPASTLVIAHSGTGGSIETVEMVQAVAERGCLTLAVTNTEDTGVGRAAKLNFTYVTNQACGPCISVISTRVLLISMLGLALGERRGVEVDTAALRKALEDVPAAGRAVLAEEKMIRGVATKYANAASWLLVGSGPNYFSAREGTLKIEEQAMLIAKAYRTGDFHHDALSLVSPQRVTVAIEAAGQANDRTVDALRAAREGLSPTMAVTWSDGPGAEALAKYADHHLALRPSLPELIVPVPMTIAFQLLGYYLGVERGFNPDTLRTDHEPNTRAWLTSFPLGTH